MISFVLLYRTDVCSNCERTLQLLKVPVQSRYFRDYPSMVEYAHTKNYLSSPIVQVFNEFGEVVEEWAGLDRLKILDLNKRYLSQFKEETK